MSKFLSDRRGMRLIYLPSLAVLLENAESNLNLKPSSALTRCTVLGALPVNVAVFRTL